MIAFHQSQMQIAKVVSPFYKKFQLLIFLAMKKISYNYQLFGLVKLQLAYQPLHVFFIHILRNSNTGFTKMTCFAKMKIRYNQ